VVSLVADLRDPFGDSAVPSLSNWALARQVLDTHNPYASLGSVEGNRLFALEELIRIINEWDAQVSAAPEPRSEALQLAYERKRERDREHAREAYELLKAMGTEDLTWAEGPWLADVGGSSRRDEGALTTAASALLFTEGLPAGGATQPTSADQKIGYGEFADVDQSALKNSRREAAERRSGEGADDGEHQATP
jgi:hypothetical protein